MRLEDLTLEMVTEAVHIYLDLAYGGSGDSKRTPDLSVPPGASSEDLLKLFHKDLVEETPGDPCVRYTMRLGNRNYPFMKLVLQEHIMAGEYFFAVDTHDDMDIKPDYPDFQAWMAVCRFNRELKQEIETAFAGADLPAASTIRRLVAARCAQTEHEDVGSSILVVDDEEDLAGAVEALLRAKGYTMFKVHDGRSGVETAKEILPDLILLDYELPEMDGLEVISCLRALPATREIPVLLCTASKISVGDIRKADGFLAKPYQEELLYKMVRRVLRARTKST